MGPGFETTRVGVESLRGERFEDEVFVVFQNGSSAPNELCEKRNG